MTKPKTKIVAIIIQFLAIIYLISPIDLIPDIIPIFGIVDDILINIIALVNTIRAFKR
jgi:uncharacterized membrane protein YkvA (DUF1232 family)